MTSNQTQQHVVFCQIYHKGADFKARVNVRTPCCTQSFLLSIPPSPKRPSGLTLNGAVVQPRWIVGEIPQMQRISVTRICGLDIARFMITTDWTWMPYVKCARVCAWPSAVRAFVWMCQRRFRTQRHFTAFPFVWSQTHTANSHMLSSLSLHQKPLFLHTSKTHSCQFSIHLCSQTRLYSRGFFYYPFAASILNTAVHLHRFTIKKVKTDFFFLVLFFLVESQ